MATTTAIAIEAELELGADVDTRAPGGVVTSALCGMPDHEGRCRWPHNNQLDASTTPVLLRTIAVVDEDSREEVVARVDTSLRQDARWTVLSLRTRDLTTDDERSLARRLSGSR